jgi:choline monooxygenase
LIGTPLWNKEMQMSEEELDERLKAAFSTEDVKNFDKAEYGLLPIRVELWGPFVYVNISGDAPPLKEYLGRVTEDLALFPFDKLVTVRKQVVPTKANWKLLAENFLDYYHVPTVHPGYCDVSRVDDHDRSQGDGMYMCHVTYPLTNAGSALDLDRFPTMKELKGTKHEITGWFHLHFPNMFYFLLPHSMFVVIIEPTGPTTSTEHVRLLVHKDGLEEAGENEAEEAIQAMWEAYNKVNGEDFAICEECQVGINAEQFMGGRMAWTFEESLNRFHKIVANCMTGRAHEIPKGDEITSKFDKIPIYNNEAEWK